MNGQGIEEEIKADALIDENIEEGNANERIQEEDPHSDHESQRSYNEEIHDLELASDISLDEGDFAEGERATRHDHSEAY